MSDTPDVLEALSLAIPDCELARHMDAAESLTALAADIEAYREAWQRRFNSTTSTAFAEQHHKAEHALLARCRGEQPTTTPQETE